MMSKRFSSEYQHCVVVALLNKYNTMNDIICGQKMFVFPYQEGLLYDFSALHFYNLSIISIGIIFYVGR